MERLSLPSASRTSKPATTGVFREHAAVSRARLEFHLGWKRDPIVRPRTLRMRLSKLCERRSILCAPRAPRRATLHSVGADAEMLRATRATLGAAQSAFPGRLMAHCDVPSSIRTTHVEQRAPLHSHFGR